MQGSQVVVVGSANADLVLDIDHRPTPGETIIGSDVVTTPGGKGANQAVAAGKIGGAVAFVGCVGDDDHGTLLRGSLASAGVELDVLRTVDAPTGTATIMVTPDGENSIIVSPGANRHVTPAMLEEVRGTWDRAAVVVLQLEIPLESVELVAAEARGRVVLNAAPAAPLPPGVLGSGGTTPTVAAVPPTRTISPSVSRSSSRRGWATAWASGTSSVMPVRRRSSSATVWAWRARSAAARTTAWRDRPAASVSVAARTSSEGGVRAGDVVAGDHAPEAAVVEQGDGHRRADAHVAQVLHVHGARRRAGVE
ncbi:PfkB family carbohydrate kinase [Georgenia sp. SUBG003]|uniref:PfkB family carbohydrate kinase n=1 Tax=Georgenia sp. SUBG003 TaxID=1497974 RepID=UPI003AB52C9F